MADLKSKFDNLFKKDKKADQPLEKVSSHRWITASYPVENQATEEIDWEHIRKTGPSNADRDSLLSISLSIFEDSLINMVGAHINHFAVISTNSESATKLLMKYSSYMRNYLPDRDGFKNCTTIKSEISEEGISVRAYWKDGSSREIKSLIFESNYTANGSELEA